MMKQAHGLQLAGFRAIGYLVFIVGYACVWAVAGYHVTIPTDLDLFFLRSVELVIQNHSLAIYSVRFGAIYPNSNGPVSLMPLSILAYVANRLGWLYDISKRNALLMAGYSPFSLLMSWEGVKGAEVIAGRNLTVLRRHLLFAGFAFNPVLWIGVLIYGHIEQPIMVWLLLLSARTLSKGENWQTGSLLALAVLTRSTAILYLPTFAMAIWLGRSRRCGIVIGSAFVVSVFVILLPFVLASPSDVLYSLVLYRGALPNTGVTLWSAIPQLSSILSHYDIGIAVTIVSVASVWLAREFVLRRYAGVYVQFYGLLALSALTFVAVTRILFAYYYLDPEVFLLILLAAPARKPRLRSQFWRLLPALFMLGCTGLELLSVWHPEITSTEGIYIGAFVVVFGISFTIVLQILHRLGNVTIQPDPWEVADY